MKTLTLLILLASVMMASEKAPDPGKITVALGDLVAAQQSLMKLFTADLPVKSAWALRKTWQAIKVELDSYEEQRVVLVKKYADKSGNVAQDKMDLFQADFKALLAIKVDLAITPISMSVIGDTVKFSVVDMTRPEHFVEMPAPKPEPAKTP